MRGWAWWLSAAALLLLLAVAALGIAATFLDPNDYEPQIVAAVQQATGRTLSLGGPLRISRRALLHRSLKFAFFLAVDRARMLSESLQPS